jgi:threonine dehydrogenase-like Zn-dependent dehydrogenase
MWESGVSSASVKEWLQNAGERVRLVLDATSGRRGGDVVLQCAGVPDAVAEGREMVRRNGTFLVLGRSKDHGAVSLDPQLITRKLLLVVGSSGVAEKLYLGHIRALPRLAARFDMTRLITRYNMKDSDTALSDMGSGRVMKPVFDLKKPPSQHNLASDCRTVGTVQGMA